MPMNNWDLNTTKKARRSDKIREESKIVLMAGLKFPFPNPIDPYPTQRLMMMGLMMIMMMIISDDDYFNILQYYIFKKLY